MATPDAPSSDNRPLAGIRVLDLSRILAGPWASQTLADLGAEVIKIERPGRGDDTRGWGPPFADTPESGDMPVSAYFLSANRNKQSVAVDIARPEGADLVRRLAAESDVLIENYKVGGLARYGLDYESLKAIRADLVYCSITGFGQTGPRAGEAGYDLLIQGMSGLMSITGDPDGQPMKVGVAIVDIVTGLYATISILAALQHRAATGAGQHIDLALFDSAIAALANQSLNYLVTGTSPGRRGNAHPSIVPYEVFPAADGHILLAIGNDSQFRTFCDRIGRTDLAADARYATNAARVDNRASLIPILQKVLSERPATDWIALFAAAGVPCGPINDLAAAFADPQAIHRGLKTELPHARLGTVPAVKSPLNFSAAETAADRGPPVLGEHTIAALKSVLGLSSAEIADLVQAGIVEAADTA